MHLTEMWTNLASRTCCSHEPSILDVGGAAAARQEHN